MELTFITLGGTGVGKTTFAKNAARERACTDPVIATVAVDFFSRKYKYGGKEYTISIRDTAGSEHFRSVTRKYIRCDGAFLMFDKDHCLIRDLEYWRNFYENNAEDPEWVLVKTKCDSQSQQDRNMDCRQFVNFASKHRKPFFEVSAREYKGVEEALEALVTRALQKRELMIKPKLPGTSSTTKPSIKSKAEQNNRDTNYTTGEGSKNVIVNLTSNVSDNSDSRGNCRC